jgi:hypothetical protein
VGKPEVKRPLKRSGRRWEDNIKMDLREIGWRDWIHLTQDRDQWSVFQGGSYKICLQNMLKINFTESCRIFKIEYIF